MVLLLLVADLVIVPITHAIEGYEVLNLVLGVVGVGGYLLQGGISFLSAQYGLAADLSVSPSTGTLA